MNDWKDFREELLSRPETKAAYDAHAADRALARALIAQRLADGVS